MRNELRMLICHQKRQLRWRDLCRQMRHRAVNKDGRADVQRITDADAPSEKTNTLAREKTDTFVCNELPMLRRHRVQ